MAFGGLFYIMELIFLPRKATGAFNILLSLMFVLGEERTVEAAKFPEFVFLPKAMRLIFLSVFNQLHVLIFFSFLFLLMIRECAVID